MIYDFQARKTKKWSIITDWEKKTKRSCNISCKKQEVIKVVHQAIFDKKNDEWSTKNKGHLVFVNDLRAKDTV